jgi:hypothetical protein
MSDYLYINMNMPPLSEFDPRPATLQWMNEKDHRTRNIPKAGEQDWFSNVFQQDNNFDNPELAQGKADEKPIKRTF